MSTALATLPSQQSSHSVPKHALKLSKRAKTFALAYAEHGNATRAAISAGYSERSAHTQGSRLLKTAKVSAFLDALLNKDIAKLSETKAYVVETIKDTIERCKQAVPVFDKQGNPTGEWRFDSTGVLRGCELLGKHEQMFVERKEIDAKITITVERVGG